ncbi:hypothetical protein AURDEDRAFT_168134 [Auricularia subglabra TFB-10046 SS5]|nr:hypothetical protein AURDEDRAFT_168134 [Auricularia subglabra TFB-10046 SS5]
MLLAQPAMRTRAIAFLRSGAQMMERLEHDDDAAPDVQPVSARARVQLQRGRRLSEGRPARSFIEQEGAAVSVGPATEFVRPRAPVLGRRSDRLLASIARLKRLVLDSFYGALALSLLSVEGPWRLELDREKEPGREGRGITDFLPDAGAVSHSVRHLALPRAPRSILSVRIGFPALWEMGGFEGCALPTIFH